MLKKKLTYFISRKTSPDNFLICAAFSTALVIFPISGGIQSLKSIQHPLGLNALKAHKLRYRMMHKSGTYTFSRSNNHTVSEMINIVHCSKGWSC